MISKFDTTKHAQLRGRSVTRYNGSWPRTDSRPGNEAMDELLAQLRPYEPGDLEKLAELLGSAGAWPPAAPPTPEDVAARWARRHIEPRDAVWVLPGPSGELVAFAMMWHSSDPTARLTVELAVLPEWQKRGIGSRLYRMAEQRARQLGLAHVTSPVYLPIVDLPQDLSAGPMPEIQNQKHALERSEGSKIQNPKWVLEARPESTGFLERRGFFPNSSYVQMRLDRIGSQPEARWPEGFHFRPMTNIDRDTERWAEIIRATFREPATGPGIAAQLAEPGSSPEGYMFAVENESGIEVGTSRARIDIMGGRPIGYLGTVGVLPEFRNRGLATALIAQTLRYLASRGLDSAVLFVETTNLGARRLYERLGWRPVYQTVHYWKTIED